MATAGGGNAPYQSGGAGGKLRKKPYRRSIPATPYDRPPIVLRNNNPSLLTKIVDPASRLISAGAHRLFDVFRKRLPSLSLQGPPDINEEPRNVPQKAGQNRNSASTGISDVEQMLQEKTFTRSEIQRLTALLHSRTTESATDDVVEKDRSKPSSSPFSYLRHEASTSGSLKKYGDERDNLNAAISPPIVSPRVREEIASPADLAKAFMGSRSTKVAPLFDSTTSHPKTPTTSVATKTANSFKNLESGFVTPRSHGRSAMYNMVRTPFPRSPSVYTQKEIGSNSGQSSALTSSQLAFGHERRMALKRRSSVLEDDIGSGGVLRRTRQKANLLSQRDKRELGYTASQQPDNNSQKLLLTNGPDENGSGLGSGYSFVPTKSTQTATKILQQLETPSPKERLTGSTISPTKLTLDMLHGQALRSLEKVDSPKLLSYPRDTQNTEVQHHVKGKEKIEENGSRKFQIPRKTSVNGDLSVKIKDNTPIVTITDLPSKVPTESPKKKRAFQMSAPEDTFEIDDDDDEIHVNNGHASFPLVENNKPETSLVANKPVSADVIETTTLPEPSGTPALVENNKPVLTEVAKVTKQNELKETENISSPKTVKFPASVPSTTTTEPFVVPQSTFQMNKVAPEKKLSFFSFGKTAENSSQFQFSANEPLEVKPDAPSDPKPLDPTSVFSSVPKNNHVKFSLPNKEENVNGKSESLFSAVPVATSKSVGLSFGNSTNNISTPTMAPASNPPTFPSLAPFQASSAANTTSFFNNTSHTATSASTTTPVTTTTVAASTIFSSAVPAPLISFGSTTTKTSIAGTGNNTNATNDKEPKPNTSSLPFTTSSFPTTSTAAAAAVTGSGLFGISFPAATSTTTGTQAAATAVTQSVPFTFGSGSSSSIFDSSTPAFGVSSIAASSEGKSGNSTSGPVFGSSTPAFGVSSIATSSEGKSGNSTSGPVFGSSTPAFGISSIATSSEGKSGNSTSGPVFGSSTPAFGISSIATSSEGKSGNSTSGPVFGSSTPAFGISSIATSSEGKSGNSTSGPVFGSTWPAAPQSSRFGSTFSFGAASSTPTPPPANASPFSFGVASSTPTPPATSSPMTFGSSFPTAGTTNSQSQPIFGNPTPVFGAASFSPNNNDQMSMEDSMAEDSMQSPGPVSPFGQPQPPAPGFMFGSATPTPTQPTVPFQFGGQPNQTLPQNLFQSSSLEFNGGGGGSFSLGSVGDKSGRRTIKVKSKNRRK